MKQITMDFATYEEEIASAKRKGSFTLFYLVSDLINDKGTIDEVDRCYSLDSDQKSAFRDLLTRIQELKNKAQA